MLMDKGYDDRYFKKCSINHWKFFEIVDLGGVLSDLKTCIESCINGIFSKVFYLTSI